MASGWVAKDDQTDDDKPKTIDDVEVPEGFSKLSVKLDKEIKWDERATLVVPKQVFDIIKGIIGAMGIGEFQQVGPDVHALVSSSSNDLLKLLKGLVESGEKDDEGESEEGP